MTLTGLFVPLITPFAPDGSVAADALAALAHEVLDAGAAGLVALGTTGEPATLTAAERRLVLDVCASVCAERGAPLIAGAGSNATADSVQALTALDPRVTAALTVVPYYSRPSEEGVVAHFRELAAASPVPLVIYNIPYRTGRTLGVETLCRLAELPNVAGFKHAVGGIDDTTIAFLARAETSVLAGDDLYAAPLLALGAAGAILASALVAPVAYADLVAAWREGRIERARQLSHRLAPLAAALFAEPNPVVIKAVLAAQGRIPSPAVRLPLLPASADALANALATATGVFTSA
ncbi:4-hydroxy-tetrahydrodipicolinate synthase [Nocardia sp. CDC159]|uniref:4-hydroxy-tetrahydrodipicolinate synthase n=1 Tax=Nocardia pulmonis TaxID=2951408 RepID=A0A9X2IZF9_9NOCA|nr:MULTISPECIES: 4-hydroxy-tetrahydrodipicolinate synthase [Nocardia]MCM6774896.1 4-hydroxy-tetrahydrodipicolinate synthase [Nocardia pulmonis]MCM6789827.1 4-hydroxy-tetrahydrodipicolinate synthase [Nocardia sp. CDC159]